MAEKLKIIPLGGLDEIGKNITVLEYGKDMIVVDCGVGFPDEDMYGVDVTYELSGKSSNLAVLNENIAHYISSSADASQPEKTEEKEKTASAKKVIIKHLSVTGSKVNLSASLTPGGKAMTTTVDLPDLHLKDLGSGKQPMTIEQAAAYILNLISLNSLDTLAKSAYKNVLKVSEETIKQTKQAAEELADSAKQTVNTLKEKGENIDGALKGLFGK